MHLLPSNFHLRESANIAIIKANQGKPIELTKSVVLGVAVERNLVENCAVFRWEKCTPMLGCQYLEYSKKPKQDESCYIKGAFREKIYDQEWTKYYWD